MRTAFGPFVFDGGAFRLERGGAAIQAQPKVLEALGMFLRRPGELVSRAELSAALWPDVVVTDQSLRQVVRKLREALDDDESSPRYLETVHGRGYRFLVGPRRSSVLPAERDAFVGRAAELASLDAALRASRLVTVLGIGGIGKTRLVRHFLGTAGERYGERWLCELEEARTLDGIVGAVSVALDVPLQGGDPVAQLGSALAARGPCVVVLDNFEQVARHARATLGRWLDLAPEARFVATSREVLGIEGERPVALAPMSDVDAVTLFEARSGARSEDAAGVAELVALLDGLPLAIELAAARSRMLSPTEIRTRMTDRFAVLARTGRAHDRHATMRATLEWSWSLLSTEERRAMGSLAVFEGSFGVGAAAAVVGADDLELLQALVDKSLIHRRGERLAMLLTVRAYAHEVAQPADRDEAERRHGAYFAAWGGAASLRAIDRDPREYERARDDLDNLVAACRRAVARGAIDVARDTLAAVWAVVRRAGPARLADELAALVASLPLDDASRVQVSIVGSMTRKLSDSPTGSIRLAEDAVAVARRIGPPGLLAEALTALGMAWLEAGRFAQAAELLGEAVEHAHDDPMLLARILGGRGQARWRLGQREEGVEMLERALELMPEPGNTRRWLLSTLAMVHLDEGYASEAAVRFDQALHESIRAHHRFGEAQVVGFRATLAFVAGDLEEASRRSERALGLARELGWRLQEGWVQLNLGRTELELGRPTARDRLEQAAATQQGAPSILGAMALGFLALVGRTPVERWTTGQEAVALARMLGDARTLANVLSLASEVAPDEGEARRCLTEALGLARSLSDPLGVAVIDGQLALFDAGDPGAEARLDRAMDHLDRVGQRIEWARIVAGRAERADADGRRRWLALAPRVPAGSRAARRLAALGP